MKPFYTKIFIILPVLLWVFSCSYPYDPPQNAVSEDVSRLLIVGDFLYDINDDELTTFDISNSDKPIKLDMQIVNFKIENITYSNGVLFLSSDNSVHIFEINDDGVPTNTTTTDYFRFQTISSCDPMVVNNDIAYVSMISKNYSESYCQLSIVNQLQIFDISNPEEPLILSKNPMEHPRGLALDGDYLFICLELNGLIVMDVSNPESPLIHATIEGFSSNNVYAKNGNLMIVSSEEIRQYDYTDIDDIQYLSSIKID